MYRRTYPLHRPDHGPTLHTVTEESGRCQNCLIDKAMETIAQEAEETVENGCQS
jgi:hypothetical protein